MNKYIRELRKLGLIKIARRWGRSTAHLVGPKRLHLDELSKAKYYELLEKYPASSYIPAELMKFSGVSAQAKIVYARLHGLAGEKGFWFGTNTASPHSKRRTLGLAEECGCSVATLRSAVRQLEDEKMIRVRRYGKGAGRRAVKPGGEHMHGGGQNVYHFLGHSLFRQRALKQ